MRRKCLPKKPWLRGLKAVYPFTSALRAWAEAQVTLCEPPFAKGLARPPVSYGVLRPGLDQPPGRGDGDLDMSKLAGVPGIVGRASPGEPPAMPLVVPTRLRDSEASSRLRVGGWRAAEERRRRWPDEAEKELGEARATDWLMRCGGLRGMKDAGCAWLVTTKTFRQAGTGGGDASTAQGITARPKATAAAARRALEQSRRLRRGDSPSEGGSERGVGGT